MPTSEQPCRKKTSADEEVYDGKGKFLMNGFYNTHCHVPMTILRGYGEGLSLQDWLFTKIFPFEAKLTPEDVYWTTKLGAMELISSGCAGISDMYFHIESEAKALDESGIKANICNGVTSLIQTKTLQATADGMKPGLSLILLRTESSAAASR